MSKLWGGRFTEEADATFARFNASLAFDQRLVYADIQGSVAYAKALQQAGILTQEESTTIQEGLQNIQEQVKRDPTLLQQAIMNGVEDVHSYVESTLTQNIGDVGGRLHTGRSRNDQVATDLRIYLREVISQVDNAIKNVQEALIDLAEKYEDVAIPGYTHLQKAMPVLWAHHMLAYVSMFSRDRERLKDTHKRVNQLPLGSAAMAGTNYPIDRQLLAELLEFDGITTNSMDAVSDRDFVVEFLNACSLIMVHLSRLSEDFIAFASTEFGLIKMGDKVSTGSSIMPQKKNPDALELIRGKSGRVFGHQMALLTILKGLPLCYNKDMQEDKEGLFDTIDTVIDSLTVAKIVLDNTEVQRERAKKAASTDYLNATEVADYLVRKGCPFRQAHSIAGKVVLGALDQNKQLEELTLQEYQSHSEFFQEDIFEAISLQATLAGKNVPGGTAPNQVKEAINKAKEQMHFVVIYS